MKNHIDLPLCKLLRLVSPWKSSGLFLSPRWEKCDRLTWFSRATLALSEISLLAGGQPSTSAKELRDRHHAWGLNIIGDAWREKETTGNVGGTIACSHGKSTVRWTARDILMQVHVQVRRCVIHESWFIYYEWNIISYYCLSYVLR